MSPIIIRYISNKFITIFFYSLLAMIFLFVNIDLIENMDDFIDRHVSWQITVLYYFYMIPSIVVLILPGVTMLAAVFSIGFMARNNEIVALKALGVSLYQIMTLMLILSLFICLGSFLISEVVAPYGNQRKEMIMRDYLKKHLKRQHLQDQEFQEPDGVIVTLQRYNTKTRTAFQIKAEQFEDGTLLKRIDAPKMFWDSTGWWIREGVVREFQADSEIVRKISGRKQMGFHFSPDDFDVIMMKPEELNFIDLHHYIGRMRTAGIKAHKWLTDYYLKFAFPLANLFLVLLSVPIAYNRRNKSLAIAFILCLMIGFLYFGIVLTGQSMGHHGRVPPFIAAWTGNFIALAAGAVNLMMTRK